MKSIKYIATWSGGKDSTYMIDWLIKNNKPVDEIIFCDTGYEFPQLYDYVNKIKKYWESLGYKVTFLNEGKALDIWNKWMFGKTTRGSNKGKVRGFPTTLGMSYCTRELKVYPLNKYIKKHYKDYIVKRYIGYAYDEKRRWNNKKENEIYPLVDIKITEKEILKWVLDKDNFYYNPLYEDFDRLGCFICPKQPSKSIKTLINKYPEYWEIIKDIEKRLKKEDCLFSEFGLEGTELLEKNIRRINEC